MMNRSHLGRKKNRNRTPPPRRLVWAHSCDRSIDGWMDGSWWTASACCDTVPWNRDGRLSRRGCNGSSSRNRCPRKWIDRYAPAYWNLPSLSLLSSRPFSPFLSLFFSFFTRSFFARSSSSDARHADARVLAIDSERWIRTSLYARVCECVDSSSRMRDGWGSRDCVRLCNKYALFLRENGGMDT